MFLKLIVLLTNREIIDLIGEAWPQTERLFDSVKQSFITLLRWSAKRLFFFFCAKRLVCKTIGPPKEQYARSFNIAKFIEIEIGHW